MDISLFSNPRQFFVVVLFIDSGTLREKTKALERLSNQRNLKLIVQPTPFEGIEFLYRIDETGGHFRSMEKDLFWEAIELKPDTAKDIVEEIGNTQHKRLCAILSQDTNQVLQCSQKLEEYKKHILSPKKS